MTTNANSHLTTPTRLTGAEIRLGHAGGRGRYRRLRLSRRRHPARLRCAAQVSHPPHPGAPRAGRRAHGRRLRARFRQGRRGHRHQRPRRHQPGHRHCHGHARFHSHRLHHRQRLQQGARHRRVPGSRHHRHHAARDQAQLPRQHAPKTLRPPSATPFRSPSPAVPAPCSSTSPRTRSRPRPSSTLPPPSREPYRPHPMLRVEDVRPRASRRTDPQRQAPHHPRRPRRDRVRRHGAGAHAGRARADSRRSHAARPRRLPRLASAQPRHDGHARRSLGQPRHSGSRSAHRLRHALRRSRHRLPGHLRAQGQEDPHRGRSRRDQQEHQGRRCARRRPGAKCWSNCCPASPAATAASGSRTIDESKGEVVCARHQEPARLRPPLRRARDARPLAHHRRQRHRGHRRRPAPDVGGAVLPP